MYHYFSTSKSKLRVAFLFVVLLFTSVFVHAQGRLDSLCHCSNANQLLTDCIGQLEQSTDLQFFFLPEWIGEINAITSQPRTTIHQMLQSSLKDTDVQYVLMDNYAVVFYKDPQKTKERAGVVESYLRKDVRIDSIKIGARGAMRPGNKVTLRGTIRDKETHANLHGVSVYVSDLKIGTVTDALGKFDFVLPPGEYVFIFSGLNYEEQVVLMNVLSDGVFEIKMAEKPVTLNEIVVTDKPVINSQINNVHLKMPELKRLPTFLGEVDVIKQIQTQAGVTTTSEASSGFNVRGGSIDQNLVLFDGVPIFNTSHALGFFTAFNAESIGDISFYKGGIPAEYGGRASSVLSLTGKEGNFRKWNGSAGIGLISSQGMLSGPLKKDTTALLVSFRTTYSDWILNLLQTMYRNINQSSVYFSDGSIKLTHKINSLSKLTFSGYTSSDRFRLASDTTNAWRNIALALKYDHVMNNNLAYSVNLNLGSYRYTVSAPGVSGFDLKYGMLYPSLKIDFNKDQGKLKSSFGFQSTAYSFSPGTYRPYSSASKPITMPTENSLESALYYSGNFDLFEHLNVEAGLRGSLYNRFGPGKVFHYTSNEPREIKYTVDSLTYSSMAVMKTYHGLEPRLLVRYSRNNFSSFKLSYNRMYQYVHLISNSSAMTPVDIWQTSNVYFKPQIADQVTFGYFLNSRDNRFEAFTEVFYKLTQNVTDFKDGQKLILNSRLETALLQGMSRSYGAEFSVSKKTGKLIGSLNYTYSRSFRRMNGRFDSERINDGKYYPSNYDQPNIVNVNGRYSLTKRIFVSGSFTYHTGRPVSVPVSSYSVNQTPITDFSERNNYRIKPYHRLDVALIVEGSHRKKKFFEGHWTFSIYNLYSRKNPYSVFFVNKGGGIFSPYQLSLIGTIVPSITYSLKF